MTKAKDHNRENVEGNQEQIPEQKAEAERKKHAEERELAPEDLVEAVENPADDRVSVPKGPGSRQGDQR